MRMLRSVVIGVLLCVASTGLSDELPVKNKELVGIWALVSREQQQGASQSWVALPNPRGLLIHDSIGHALEIVTQGGRQAYKQTTPSPEEALQAFSTYTGFFGSVAVDPQRSTVTYVAQGNVHPNRIGQKDIASYESSGNRFAVTRRVAESGSSRTVRDLWERLPDLAEMPPLLRQLVGFWEWTADERVNSQGDVVASIKRAPSIIVYTPTGHVAVHFVPTGRKPFAADKPTGEEARAAMTSYVSYFGVYLLYPDAVLHHYVLVNLYPGNAGITNRRFLRVSEPTATLTFPPGVVNGVEVRQRVTVKRLSGLAEMSSQAQ
jgi:hypothetical protein